MKKHFGYILLVSLVSVLGIISLDSPVFAENAEEGKELLGELSDKIHISGTVEVEASYESNDEDTGDINLSTVELGIDADIAKYVKGHLLFLYEEDGEGRPELDEGVITLGGVKDFPFYISTGRLYVPFGKFNSHFISDPITLEIGETRETAVLLGYTNDYFEGTVGVFNGDIDKATADNVIESYVASVVFNPPIESKDITLSLGVSYISNIADSKELKEKVVTGSVKDYVNGLSAFLSANYKNLTLEAEYLGALDKFQAGELDFDNGKSLKPEAYNLELAYAIKENLEIAGKYEFSNDWDSPEKQYGVAVSYGIFENTTIAVEYLHGEYENNDERDLITTQLAIEF